MSLLSLCAFSPSSSTYNRWSEQAQNVGACAYVSAATKGAYAISSKVAPQYAILFTVLSALIFAYRQLTTQKQNAEAPESSSLFFANVKKAARQFSRYVTNSAAIIGGASIVGPLSLGMLGAAQILSMAYCLSVATHNKEAFPSGENVRFYGQGTGAFQPTPNPVSSHSETSAAAQASSVDTLPSKPQADQVTWTAGRRGESMALSEALAPSSQKTIVDAWLLEFRSFIEKKKKDSWTEEELKRMIAEFAGFREQFRNKGEPLSPEAQKYAKELRNWQKLQSAKQVIAFWRSRL